MNQCLEKSKNGGICKTCGKEHDRTRNATLGESYNSLKAREATMKSERTFEKGAAEKIAEKLKAQGSRASGIRKAELEAGMSYNDLRKAEQDRRRSPEFVKSLARHAREALANIKSTTEK